MSRLDQIEARVNRMVGSGNLDELNVLLQQDLPWLFRMVRNNPSFFGAPEQVAVDEDEADELRAELTDLAESVLVERSVDGDFGDTSVNEPPPLPDPEPEPEPDPEPEEKPKKDKKK